MTIKYKSLLAIVFHYFKENWVTLLLLIAAIVFVGLSTDWGQGDISLIFTKFWDPWLGIAGILVTFGLTLYYVRAQWRDSLEKKLNVHFINTRGLYIASCYNVYILPNGEMRSLGQQVGQQMFESQFLKFNPSVTESQTAQPMQILTEQGRSKWVMVYNIVFQLNTDEYNAGSSYYAVWNINGGKISEKIFMPSANSFHQENNNIFTLMSSDIVSIEAFGKIKNTATKSKGHLYLLNSSVITTYGKYVYEPIKIDSVRKLLKEKSYTSAIGHEETASIMSRLTGIEIATKRISVVMQGGDQAIVFRLKERLEEGRVYTVADMQKMETEWGLLTREF